MMIAIRPGGNLSLAGVAAEGRSFPEGGVFGVADPVCGCFSP